MKKGIVIGIVFLLVVMSFTSISGIQIYKNIIIPSGRGNILYVGGSGEGNYSKIQDAIENASDGDTVFVYDDSSPYNEHIIIDKSIDLIGENKKTTIIDGEEEGKVVWIQEYSDGVTINGFTIQNCGYDSSPYENAGIYISSNFNIIHNNNIIFNNDFGIKVFLEDEYTYNNIIYGNTVKNNRDGIIMIDSLDYQIFDNNISNNRYGIYFHPYLIPMQVVSFSSYHVGKIYRNNLHNNSYGIYQWCWGGDDIYDNDIINNEYGGIVMDAWYDFGGYNNIYNNSIMKNGCGIDILVFVGGSNHNNIYQNNIFCNKIGVNIDGDFSGYGGHDNKIYQNNFIGNLFYNARDRCNNQWDNGYLSGGNYWDDYRGFDWNSDGIGDSPYRLRPYFNGNKDRFPLMEPIGDVPEIIINPVNKAFNFNILNRFLERFPLLDQLLDFWKWNIE